MSKKNFVSLIFGVIGAVMFALGMCMCLLPEWNAFQPGVVCGVIGVVALLILVLVRRKMDGKAPIKLSAKTIGTLLFAMVGALVFGTGMCMTMVWEGMMIQGIAVGLVGIVLLLCLIPMIKGFK
ncbi:MAG: hypothetical protein IJ486_07400 [Firmicutes bacterium]|nr:hypothetical protein [Bacillota bacterium]